MEQKESISSLLELIGEMHRIITQMSKAPRKGGNWESKLVLDVNDMVEMGFSRGMAYSLLNREDLPNIKLDGRKFMHKEKFLNWLAAHSEELER